MKAAKRKDIQEIERLSHEADINVNCELDFWAVEKYKRNNKDVNEDVYEHRGLPLAKVLEIHDFKYLKEFHKIFPEVAIDYTDFETGSGALAMLDFDKDYEIARYLLDYNASPAIGGNHGCSLTCQLARRKANDKEFLDFFYDFLFIYNGEVNTVDKVGFTPLYHAVIANNTQVVQMLLDAGATLQFTQNGEIFSNGKTVLEKLEERGEFDSINREIISLLKSWNDKNAH